MVGITEISILRFCFWAGICESGQEFAELASHFAPICLSVARASFPGQERSQLRVGLNCASLMRLVVVPNLFPCFEFLEVVVRWSEALGVEFPSHA